MLAKPVNKLYSVTAPLYIHTKQQRKQIIAECFPHEKGLIWFESGWHLRESALEAIHLVEGELKGEGPWKIADYIINLVGCHATTPELAFELAEWEEYKSLLAHSDKLKNAVIKIARQQGAIL